MPSTIITKNGSGAPLAADLVAGELAVDLTNGRLYTEDTGGSVIEIGLNPSGNVDVTGTVTADGLTVDGDTITTSINASTGTSYVGMKLNNTGGNTYLGISNSSGTGFVSGVDAYTTALLTESATDLVIGTNNVKRQLIADNGDISFYEDTGTTAKFFWDASAESLGIGTESPTSGYIFDARGWGSFQHPTGDSLLKIQTGNNTGTSLLYFSDSDSVFSGSIAYLHTDDAMRFNTAATERLRIDAQGQVRLSNTTPVWDTTFSSLVTKGGFVGSQSASYMYSGNNMYYNGGFKFSTAADATLYEQSFGKHIWYRSTDVTPAADAAITLEAAMTLDDSGNVGIGTASPDTLLNLESAAPTVRLAPTTQNNGSSLELGVLNAGTTAYAKIDAVNLTTYDTNIRFFTNTTTSTTQVERMRIDASGVIYTNNPAPSYSPAPNAGYKPLFIGTATLMSGGSVATDFYLTTNGYYATDGTYRAANNGHMAGMLTTGAGEFVFRRSTASVTAGSQPTWNESIRIDASGNLLVGTTDSSNTSGSGVKIANPTSPADDGKIMVVGASSTAAQDGYQMYSTGASAFRFFVSYAGSIHATSTSITAISDESLKENIRDLDKGLDTIKALKPRRFDWKNGDGNDIMGFVAQEVQDVLPELVHDYKLNETETKLGLKMGDMIPSLVKAIQEQQDLIESLTARIAQLEGAN